MWNSPNKETELGTRYTINEIAPLVNAIGLTLDGYLRKGQIDDPLTLSCDPSLSTLNLGQYIYAVYRTCNSLLDDKPAPNETPPDLEGIVRDMLHFLHNQIQAELRLDPCSTGEGNGWMQDTWRLYQFTQRKRSLRMPSIPRLDAISPADWEKIVFESIGAEFLAGTTSLANGGKAGMVVKEDPWKSPFETPGVLIPEASLGEFMMATHYLLYLVWAAEIVNGEVLNS